MDRLSSLFFLLLFSLYGNTQDLNKDTLQALLYIEEADTMIVHKKFDEAIRLYQKAADLYYTHELWFKYFENRNNIGWVLRRPPRTKEKEQQAYLHSQQIIEESIQKMGPNNAARAQGLFRIASINFLAKKYKEAIQLFHKTIKVYQNYPGGVNNARYFESHYALGLIYNQKNEFDQALEYFHKTWDLRDTKSATNHYRLFATCYFIALIYKNHLNQLDKAIEYGLHSIRIAENDPNRQKDIAFSYGNVAIIYHLRLHYKKSIEYCKKGLLQFDQFGFEKDSVFYSLHNNIGVNYTNLGWYSKAMEHFDELRAIKSDIQNIKQESKFNLIDNYINIGRLERKRQNYNKGLTYQQKALQLLDQFQLTSSKSRRTSCHHEMAVCYKELGQLDLALEYNKKATDHASERNSQLSFHQETGTIYLEMKQYDRALNQFELAKKLLLKNSDKNHPSYTAIHNLEGATYLKKEQIDASLLSYQKGIIKNLKYKDANLDIYWNPNQLESFVPNDLLTSLKGKGDAMIKKYELKGQKKDLQFALKTFHLCDSLINHIRYTRFMNRLCMLINLLIVIPIIPNT